MILVVVHCIFAYNIYISNECELVGQFLIFVTTLDIRLGLYVLYCHYLAFFYYMLFSV